MPMWCTGVEFPSSSQERSLPHHRIVRVPPGESVVLNSAERAPYLLILEILHNDLDFDPGKRPNKELLKGMIRKDLGSSKAPQETFSRRERREKRPAALTAASSTAEEAIRAGDDEDDAHPLSQSLVPLSPSTDNPSGDLDEEVDLVEQVYGRDLSVHQTPNLADTYVLPAPPKNKALDVATWTRSASSSPSSSSPLGTPSMSDPFPFRGNKELLSPQGNLTPNRLPALSLDEYSQRMRTAAVMLAQLNASIVKETFVARPTQDQPDPANQPTTVASWLPMSNWLTGVNSTTSSGPIHPSLSGSAASKASQIGTTRMRLPPAEVAAIRDRIMQEMLVLEEERVGRMQANPESNTVFTAEGNYGNLKTAEDEQIIRRELNKEDPSAVVFSESWAAKKVFLTGLGRQVRLVNF